RTDGDDAFAPALDGGPDLVDRKDRADADERVARRDRDQLGRLERLEHTLARPCLRGALVDDPVNRVAVAPRDEPFLELELTGWHPDPTAPTDCGWRPHGQT